MKQHIKHIKGFPVIGPLAERLNRAVSHLRFRGSESYWEARYAQGGNSGTGSYGALAELKAEIINDFVERHGVGAVIEFGCGDGNQLKLYRFTKYTGFDVSPTAVTTCRDRYRDDPSKSFAVLSDYGDEKADLSLSIDVIYHLVEDPVYEKHMRCLFDAAERFVIIYSSNTDAPTGEQVPHVRHRCFTRWVEAHRPQWRLTERVPNRYAFDAATKTGSFADFYLFARARV